MGMCPIGATKEVKWFVKSEKDHRWNKSGTSTVAMVFQRPPELDRWLTECDKIYGARPKDLFYNVKYL